MERGKKILQIRYIEKVHTVRSSPILRYLILEKQPIHFESRAHFELVKQLTELNKLLVENELISGGTFKPSLNSPLK